MNKTAIDINIIRNNELSTKAKGIYSVIQMLGGNIYDLFQIFECCKDKEDAIKNGIKELIEKGYFKGIDKSKGCLYVITDSYGNYKIGMTSNLLERNYKFSTDLPKHKVVITFYSKWYKEIEKMLHKEFCDKNIRGEWFELNGEDLEKILELCRTYETEVE